MRTVSTILTAVLGTAALAVFAGAAAPEGPVRPDDPEFGLKGAAALFLYTNLDLDECKAHPDSEAGYGRWTCKGIDDDWPVHVTQDDMRMTVSYGPRGPEEAAARQTFGPFSRIHGTLEWVLTAQGGGKPVPAATILRFYLQYLDEKTGETGREHPILVVTQLKPGAVCHVAYVDAKANPNANADARAAALRLAGSFDCAAEPELVGPQTPGVFME